MLKQILIKNILGQVCFWKRQYLFKYILAKHYFSQAFLLKLLITQTYCMSKPIIYPTNIILATAANPSTRSST